MSRSIRTTSMATHRIAVALAVSALLAVASFMAIAPNSASASSGDGRCLSNEFCLGWNYDVLYHPKDGVYDNDNISDYKLYDNWFVPNWGQGPVDNNTWSAVNKKSVDVLVFDGAGYTGAGACIHAGRGINLPYDWLERIGSWKIAARSVCDGYRVLAW